ncbi:MAG TPA: hypothetical protein VF300_00805 [Methanothrix sp.]
MDVSFSAWRHSREESLQLKGDSFSFLFDRRYTNRLNRMSRVFFEAYVAATKELAAQEDRFPSLSEIDAKMESGAVYAFKDRLMKNTEFFEEVKISGVSYLVPRALKFVDTTGTYTDLILSFEEGTVVLPTRRKTPLLPEPTTPEEEETSAPELDQEALDLVPEVVPATNDLHEPKPESYSRIFDEITEPVATAEVSSPPEPLKDKKDTISPYAKVPEMPAGNKKTRMPSKVVALLVFVTLLTIAAVLFFISSSMIVSPIQVEYSAYLSNSSNESYLGLDITNPKGMANDMEMTLPPNIDQSISARGGIVTISHGASTMVRMNSSSDASVKIYLQGNWTTIPVTLSFAPPDGYDTSLQVHGKDYFVTRKNETLILKFNLTGEGVRFEQSYLRKH